MVTTWKQQRHLFFSKTLTLVKWQNDHDTEKCWRLSPVSPAMMLFLTYYHVLLCCKVTFFFIYRKKKIACQFNAF